MKTKLRVAAVQMNSSLDKAKNLAEAERLIRHATAGGAELIVLPELFNLYGDLRQAAAKAEPLEGPTAQLLSALARELAVYLVGGSFAEVAAGENRAYNTSLTIDPSGNVLATYRKMHLFNVDLGAELRVCESDNLLPGTEITCLETDFAKLGISICYDLRFPELYREQASQGVELLCIPAAFTQRTGRDHWELLVRTRAVENQCYVIAANQVGEHAPGSVSYGRSLIVDPWGKVLTEASGERAEVVLADLSGELLTDIRRKLPALKNRILP
ncbi:2-oxoglutaramate amidase [Anatilimnocola aggregata]|uniref:2-oxoglutaramate amidase n=1 Tax=Anatilimnocola aggregata TaxID=2528021 RepID=A0A517YHW6_9BACT|nr:carbon-nitrogen hydrolase family protein [Anatilimnocola aggregata]QDU29805.1 2-oxoglutaramate amidase [Anatilimnocola aggregata]